MTKTTAISTKVPDDFFENLPFWKELTQDEQKAVVQGTNRMAGALNQMILLKTEVARGAVEVQDVLKKEERWTKFLHSFRQSYRTLYRWIDRFTQLSLPPAVLDAAAEQNVDVIDGQYFSVAKELPSPKKGSENAFIARLKETVASRRSKARRTRQKPAERAERDAWRSVIKEWKASGLEGRAGHSWKVRLIGRLMTALGLPAQRIEPEAVPEDFEPKVGYPAGRPRKP